MAHIKSESCFVSQFLQLGLPKADSDPITAATICSDQEAPHDWIALTAEQLKPPQFAALALAEAEDCDDDELNGLRQRAEVDEDQTMAVSLEYGCPGGEVVETASEELVAASPVLDGAVSVVTAVKHRVERTGCPHCGCRKLQRWGGASGLPRYRCSECRRTFNGLTGTPLARLRKKEHWADQTKALMTGESLVKAAQRYGVAETTAFRWRHRFLLAPALDKPKQLIGIVETDETFILESFKGRRSDLPRPARKRGGKAAKRGLSAEQIPVLVARDRTGATTDAVLPKLNKASIVAALDGVVTPANQLCCYGELIFEVFQMRNGGFYPLRIKSTCANQQRKLTQPQKETVYADRNCRTRIGGGLRHPTTEHGR